MLLSQTTYTSPEAIAAVAERLGQSREIVKDSLVEVFHTGEVSVELVLDGSGEHWPVPRALWKLSYDRFVYSLEDGRAMINGWHSSDGALRLYMTDIWFEGELQVSRTQLDALLEVAVHAAL